MSILYTHDWQPLEGDALAQALADVAAGIRLKRTTDRGECLMHPDEEAALRAEWAAEAESAAAAEAARQAAKADAAVQAADAEAAAQFARLAALRTMSPAQVSNYIATRYPAQAANLADANAILTKMRDDIETLAIAVAILARRL